MKTCPRCQLQVDDEDNYCRKCGWNFHGRKKGNGDYKEKRRYEQKKFENADFEEINNWLKQNNGKIEITRINGNIKFADTGLLFKKQTWYAQYCTISYYPNTNGHHYGMTFDVGTDVFLSKGGSVDRNVQNSIPNGAKILFDCMRSGYVPGNRGGQTHCRCVIYEKKGN